ncbi:MAG: hypothetical protein QME68_05075, partial [Elusimicrobiota bacterium]|nr:hypothetical protein [Elusimicrobiota bacterium]
LMLSNWHKHLLVIGLDTPEQYRKLPVAGNLGAEKFNFILLWPVIVIIVTLIFLRRKNLLKGLIVIVSLLILINNFPFRSSKYSIYTEHNEKPYQDLIDYTISNNGLVYWAHPEAPNYKLPTKVGAVLIQTLPYPESILNTQNYTGFAYFWEGDEIVGKPGGYWDKVLIEYCKGERKFPVWSVGELDYITDGVNNNYIDLVKNVLLVNELTKDAIMDCLRSGRYYVICKSRTDGYELVLNKCILKDGKYSATLGETLRCSSAPKMIFSISTSDGNPRPARISLISSGKVIQVFERTIPAEIELQLEISSEKKGYYRIEVTSTEGTKLVSNPIFFIL